MTPPRPYVDRPVGDQAAAAALASRGARRWGLPDPSLLRAGMNAIFAAGDAVLRVTAPNGPADASIALATVLAEHGLRVARPLRDDALESGDLAVTCWARIEPTGEPIDWVAVGRLVRRLHELDESVLPAGYPLSTPAAFPWWDFEALLAEVGGSIDAAARAGLDAAIGRWPHWRRFDDPVVCHGDVHPGNVMMSADGPILIDWDLLCHAPRGWDHAPLLPWTSRWGGEPGVYERLAEGYGRSLRDDPAAEAYAELRLVAATLMRIRAARADPGAQPEAERRLRYWRGDPDAPTWRAQ